MDVVVFGNDYEREKLGVVDQFGEILGRVTDDVDGEPG
jgi:hypothetical protein